MATFSIDDAEIALVKAMLGRRMRNNAIQFYFNRSDRPVNSGRITEIKLRRRGASVAAASDADLDSFLAGFTATGTVPAAPKATSTVGEPSDADRVATMFANTKGAWRLVGGETDEVECKREVDVRKLAPVVRAIAGMANNKGGVVLLGVEDKSGLVVGLPTDDFEKLDLVKITNAVKSHLTPTPSFAKGTVEVGGMTVGFVTVDRCENRPVIVQKVGDRLEDGAILYRYPAQTDDIRSGELRALLEERDARRFRELADATLRLAEIGVGRAAILNTDDGNLDLAGGRRLVLDPALLDQIKFIREGEFDQVAGAPTLKVVGEVSTSGDAEKARRLITDQDILRNFLDQEAVLQPLEYIRFAVAGTTRSWTPLFYFARQAGLTPAELTGLVEGVSTTRTRHKAEAVERARGARSALYRHPGTPAKRLKALVDGDFSPPEDLKAAENLVMAVQGIPGPVGTLDQLLGLVKQANEMILAAERHSVLSNVYKAAARLDEVFFGDAPPPNI